MEKKYEEIDFICGYTIRDCVNELIKYKYKGRFVYGVFNGHKLYSDTVTLDSAYKQITGLTKKEYDEEIERQYEESERAREEHQGKIPELAKEYMERARKIISKDKWMRWDEIVPIRLHDLYEGWELEQCLEVISKLNNKEDFECIKEFINKQGHSGMSFNLMCSMVEEFHDKGNELVDFLKRN